ncbi:MAG: hypothetical protein R6X07_06575 [Desulfatiglandales bacterium]
MKEDKTQNTGDRRREEKKGMMECGNNENTDNRDKDTPLLTTHC